MTDAIWEDWEFRRGELYEIYAEQDLIGIIRANRIR